MTELLTVEDVAARLKVSADTVYDLAATGKLVGSRIGVHGGLWRFTAADVDAYLAATKHAPIEGVRKRRQRRSVK